MLEIVKVPGGFNVVDEEGSVLNEEVLPSQEAAEAFRTDMMKSELMLGAGVGGPPMGPPAMPPAMPAPPMGGGVMPPMEGGMPPMGGGMPPMGGNAGNPIGDLLKKMGGKGR